MGDRILVERRGPVQIVRMNRPEKKNAITRAMYAGMATALHDGDADPAIRCHVIFGLPGVFSSGNDIADFLAHGRGGERGRESVDFLMALALSEKPLLSGVDGIAVGIGVTINLHCDLTFATPRTVFRAPFLDLGLVPEAGSTLTGPRIMGYQQAFGLFVLGEGFSAEQAKAAGLIYAVVGENELEERTLRAAQDLVAKPPEALKIARGLMRPDREELVKRIRIESDHISERLQSEEAKAAFSAFLDRKRS
ncbi:MAG TPA: crotonase/enoyl-CoA hydratase family protein [Rhizobiaceae bacterium]|nr:crotonase/enoyl-CoA hydratase family protein [Rhizobiaceae bacterium]